GKQFFLEGKRASPSIGLFWQPFDFTEITQAYKQYASCLSVLSDEKYFQCSFDYLAFVRSQVEQPLFCKDVFFDEFQVYMAGLYGG
ncbi:bifunctional indole-3-glycerol phosphate synthase/phosphoribosylanthranilate isomerase, partial [Pseudoalteromonas sp. S3173]